MAPPPGQRWRVPGVDGSYNQFMTQVVGNKSDTVAGNSLVSLVKQAIESGGKMVESAGITFHTTAVPMFTATGLVKIKALVGRVTTIVEAQATTIQVIVEDGLLGDVDITTAGLDANMDGVDTIYWVTGDFSDDIQMISALVLAQEWGEHGQEPWVFRDADISLESGDISTGAMTWTAVWEPLEIGATLVAA